MIAASWAPWLSLMLVAGALGGLVRLLRALQRGQSWSFVAGRSVSRHAEPVQFWLGTSLAAAWWLALFGAAMGLLLAART